jgi:hypothetical protein
MFDDIVGERWAFIEEDFLAIFDFGIEIWLWFVIIDWVFLWLFGSFSTTGIVLKQAMYWSSLSTKEPDAGILMLAFPTKLLSSGLTFDLLPFRLLMYLFLTVSLPESSVTWFCDDGLRFKNQAFLSRT